MASENKNRFDAAETEAAQDRNAPINKYKIVQFPDQTWGFFQPGLGTSFAPRVMKSRRDAEQQLAEYQKRFVQELRDAKKYAESAEAKRAAAVRNEIESLMRSKGMTQNEAIDYLRSRGKIRLSRPGAPDTFAVEDRFYFGKGRKERFAEPREIEAKIRAWIDSRGLPIGSQETNALSYVAAQHMIRGGASIEQAVKSAARRHAQIGLASAGLRTWLEENA